MIGGQPDGVDPFPFLRRNRSPQSNAGNLSLATSMYDERHPGMGPLDGTDTPAPPPHRPVNPHGSSSPRDDATDFRDTVLFLVHQQGLRHGELMDAVRGLATTVGTIQAAQAAASSGASAPALDGVDRPPASAPPPPPDADLVGFAGSYAATQTAWAKQHHAPLSHLREEELVAARRRIVDLERQVASLREQVRQRDETVRRLTQRNTDTLLSVAGAGRSSPSPARGLPTFSSPMLGTRHY